MTNVFYSFMLWKVVSIPDCLVSNPIIDVSRSQLTNPQWPRYQSSEAARMIGTDLQVRTQRPIAPVATHVEILSNAPRITDPGFT